MANIKIKDINLVSSESFISKLEDDKLQLLGGITDNVCFISTLPPIPDLIQR